MNRIAIALANRTAREQSRIDALIAAEISRRAREVARDCRALRDTLKFGGSK